MCRPGKAPIPHWREKIGPVAESPDRQMAGSPFGSRLPGAMPPVGLRPPYGPAPAPDSHPDCRAVLILIVAQQRASLSGVGGSRQKIERALKNQRKRIFGRTSQKSSFGSEFLPYGVAA
jgi:hypothetical protein